MDSDEGDYQSTVGSSDAEWSDDDVLTDYGDGSDISETDAPENTTQGGAGSTKQKNNGYNDIENTENYDDNEIEEDDNEPEDEGVEEEKGGDDNEIEEDDDDEIEDDKYLQKLDLDMSKNFILENHPECIQTNYNEVSALSVVVRDEKGNIIDDLHKTTPILTKYEATRIIGARSLQLASGAKPYIDIPPSLFEPIVIAKMELEQKAIPVIIKRGVGKYFEYWKLEDLEQINF